MKAKRFFLSILMSSLFALGSFFLSTPQEANAADPIILCVDTDICAIVGDIILIGVPVIIPK